MVKLHIVNRTETANPIIYVISLSEDKKYKLPESLKVTRQEKQYIEEMLDKKMYFFRLPHFTCHVFMHFVKISDHFYKNLEEFRIEGNVLNKSCKKYNFKDMFIESDSEKSFLLAYTEGFLLTDYQFDKYLSKKEKNHLKNIFILNKELHQKDVDFLTAVIDAVYIARNLVNEPASVLTSIELSKKIEDYGKKKSFFTEVLSKSKIESLKMGGLLAVNQGSSHPPTFNILEWNPAKKKNTKPIILIGKGIVYDTGGLSLKPTTNSMDYMKSDMAGAAAVIGIFCAAAAMKLNLHLIGLIPATDNRPGQNAYAPGDIIRMYDGSTVEVLNTDAEGRLILADALEYAKKYKPQLVIDIATLTGAAAVAIGKYGIAAFTNVDKKLDNNLIEAGNYVNERLVSFPMWDDYSELIKSDIADLKNVGGKDAGAITAAKFLEKFTDYPWVHLDIAGCAFNSADYKYFTKGGSGIGVRLIIKYLQTLLQNDR